MLKLSERELRVIVDALTQYVDNAQDMDDQPAGVAIAERLTDALMPIAYPMSVDAMLTTIAAVHGDDDSMAVHEMMAVEMADKAKRRAAR
jgi:hypothetical protein